MKNGLFILFCFLLVQATNAQPKVDGTWEGKLSVGANSLRLVVHITGGLGAYSATLDSPDQGAKGIPVSKVQHAGDSLHLEVAAAGAKLSGRLVNDSTLSGQWRQGGAVFPIEMKKSATNKGTAAVKKRPQTPVPPFSYQSKDVTYHNADRSIQFGATVTKPFGEVPYPAVLLITGSGPQNRDEELFGHKPFAVIADDLTKRGFLVLRVDDRGVGQTTGDHRSATSEDFADDVKAGLAYLRSLPEVNKSKIGLLGHSEGGMIAQMVGAEEKDLAFLVLMAAPGIPVVELMALQNKAILLSGGMNEAAADAYLKLYRPLIAALATTTPEQGEQVAMQVLNNWIKNTPKEMVIATTNIRTEQDKQKLVASFVRQTVNPWFQYFLQYNPDDYVKKLKTKVLALNGDKDVQVTSSANLAGLRASLKKSNSPQYDVVALEGLNHLFQRCQKCTVQEYGELEETIAPAALEAVGNWLVKEIKNK
ncbi:alpha/beta fold hydrolase [Flavisolibacter sp. BT320]|nr:alpha/beta fold hydrolase [Flavisolibacter longurius]